MAIVYVIGDLAQLHIILSFPFYNHDSVSDRALLLLVEFWCIFFLLNPCLLLE